MKETNLNFNGGFIEASQEAYGLLVELGIKDHISAFNVKNKNHKPTYLLVYNGVFVGENSNVASREAFKQFYINKGKLSWDKPEEFDLATLDDIDMPKSSEEYNKRIGTQINSMEELNELPIVEETVDKNSYFYKQAIRNSKREK